MSRRQYFSSSSEVIRTAVLLHIRFPLSLRQVEDLLHERGADISHETVRFGWNRFGAIFAAELRERFANTSSGDDRDRRSADLLGGPMRR